MATGLCASCGTPAPIDGVFCGRCGASLGRSFVALEPLARPVTQPPVVRRAEATHATRRRALWPLAAAVGVLCAVVLGAVVIGHDGGTDEPDADPVPPTTLAAAAPTSVERRPGVEYLNNQPGPIFGAGSVAAGVLYVADGSLLKRVDVATGEVTDLVAVGFTVAQLVAVERGVFAVARTGEVYAIADETPGAPLLVGNGGALVRSASPDTVWVSRDQFCTDCASTLWYEVDLAGRKSAAIELARGLVPLAATDRGLVWQTPRGIYTAKPKETPRLYANGTLIGARGDTIVWFGCDDAALLDCSYYAGDAGNAKAHRLDAVGSAGRPSLSSIERLGAYPVSADLGTVAIPRVVDGRMPLVDLDSGEVRFVPLGATSFRYNLLTFTAAGDWLVAFQTSARTSLRAVSTHTGESVEVPQPQPSWPVRPLPGRRRRGRTRRGRSMPARLTAATTHPRRLRLRPSRPRPRRPRRPVRRSRRCRHRRRGCPCRRRPYPLRRRM